MFLFVQKRKCLLYLFKDRYMQWKSMFVCVYMLRTSPEFGSNQCIIRLNSSAGCEGQSMAYACALSASLKQRWPLDHWVGVCVVWAVLLAILSCQIVMNSMFVCVVAQRRPRTPREMDHSRKHAWGLQWPCVPFFPLINTGRPRASYKAGFKGSSCANPKTRLLRGGKESRAGPIQITLTRNVHDSELLFGQDIRN